MAKHYRALVGTDYPDPASLKIVQQAGGFSKLTPEQRATVKVRRVEAGEYCDDMPVDDLAYGLAHGFVEVVDDTPPAAQEPVFTDEGEGDTWRK